MAPRFTPKGVEAPRIQAENPGAYPIDTYARPPEDNDLSRLSSALGHLAPSLGRFSEVLSEEGKAKGAEQARADFLAMKASGQAIKAGTLQPAESGWYRRAYHETVGQLAASQYGSDLDMAMRNPENPIAHSTEPADFDKWASTERAAWLKANVGKANGDFTAGFNEAVVGAELNLRNRFVAEAGARLIKNNDNAIYTKLQTVIADLRKKGGTPEQMGFWFQTIAHSQYFLNPKAGAQMASTMTEAIFDAARMYEDPELLKIGDFIESSVPGAKLSKTQNFFSKADDVAKEIRNNRQNRLNAEAKDEKRLREDAIDNIYDAVGKVFTDAPAPEMVDPKPFLDQMATADPDQTPKLMRVLEAYKKGGAVLEDQELLRTLYSRAFDGDLSNDDIITRLGDQQISIKTAKDLRAQLRLNKSGRGAKALIQDPYYTAGVRNLTAEFVMQSGLTDTHRQSAAEQQMRREWIEYRQGAGATAKAAEVNDWVQNAIERNFRRFSYGGTFTGKDRLIDRHKETPQPDAAGSGPQPLKWEKEPVMDRADLDQLAREHESIRRGDRKTFSPVALELIHRFPDLMPGGVIDPALVTKFIEAQRISRAFNPSIDDSRPDQLR